MVETRPRPGPPGDGLTVHHVSDTHIGYRPWSYAEHAHMIGDLRKGLIPPVDLMIHTGDVIDGGDDVQVEDEWAVEWLEDARLCAPSLVACGNHDLRDRSPRTRLAWETAYDRAANTFIDVQGVRFVTWTVDFHDWNDPWIVPESTWSWLDGVIGAASGPVVLAQHFPPWELGVTSPDHVEPRERLAELIADHPAITGMLCGHMHWQIDDSRAARFVTIGGRPLPVLTDISAMLTLPGGLSRDQSAQVQSHSAYVTMHADRWEVRYRAHGTHAWSGPADQRVTRLDLASGTVTRGMVS